MAEEETSEPTGIYEVHNFADGTVVPMGADEIVAKFAKAKEQSKINKWFWEFVENETFQEYAGVKITTVEPSEAFDQLYVEMKGAEKRYRETKKAVQAALVQVLDNLLDTEIKAGAIHKASDSKTAKAQYTIVEKYLLQASPDLKTFIPKHRDRFPKYVVAELERIMKDRAATVASRLAKQKGK